MTYTITQNADGYVLKLFFVDRFENIPNRDVTNTSIFNRDPKQAFLTAFRGMTMEYRIQGTLYDNEVDISDGTAPTSEFPDGVVDIYDQIKYIANFWHTWKPTSYTLEGPGLPSDGVTVFVERSNPRKSDVPMEGGYEIQATAGIVIGDVS